MHKITPYLFSAAFIFLSHASCGRAFMQPRAAAIVPPARGPRPAGHSNRAGGRRWLLAMVAKAAGRWLAGVVVRPDVARLCPGTYDTCYESRAARRAPLIKSSLTVPCLVRLPSERARGAQGGVPHRCAGNGRQCPGLRRPHSRGRAESGRRGPGRLRPLLQDLAFWPRVKRAVVRGHSCRPAVRCCQSAAYSTVQYSTAVQYSRGL